MNNGRHHVGQTLQMADRTLLGEALAGSEVAVVVDMVVAIGTIGSGSPPPSAAVWQWKVMASSMGR